MKTQSSSSATVVEIVFFFSILPSEKVVSKLGVFSDLFRRLSAYVNIWQFLFLLIMSKMCANDLKNKLNVLIDLYVKM